MTKRVAAIRTSDASTEEEMKVFEEKFKKDRSVNKLKLDFLKGVKTKKDFEKFKLFFERKNKEIEESNIGLSLYRSSLGEMAIKSKIKESRESENPITRIMTFCFGSAMRIENGTADPEFSQKDPEELLEEVKEWVEAGNDIKEFGTFADYMLIELFDKTHYHFSLYETIEGEKNKQDDKKTDVVVNPNFCDFKKVKYGQVSEGLSQSREQINYFK